MTVLTALILLASTFGSSASAPSFKRAYELKANEGVFAYSRVTPDGRYLTYASQARRDSLKGGMNTTVVLVDLTTRRRLFSEEGMDGYFSPDGERMIYLNTSRMRGGVAMHHVRSGKTVRNVAGRGLGDYYSWADHKGRDLIMTITGNYYYLEGDKAVSPHHTVPSCPGIGPAGRPLISRDGTRISTFVRGTVVVRNLTDCAGMFETGIAGAKTDFSFDGRYLAMHAPRSGKPGYDILVVDMRDRTVRNVTKALAGNSYFPSWTRDGRLSFRYDGPDYRGFMFASNILSAPAAPLPNRPEKVPATRTWSQIFPETQRPSNQYHLVVVYGAWSAHTPLALRALGDTRDYISTNALDVAISTATDPGSREDDVDALLRDYVIDLPRMPLAPERASLTEVVNQSPATLLFRDGVLIDRRLGAQTSAELQDWLHSAGVRLRAQRASR